MTKLAKIHLRRDEPVVAEQFALDAVTRAEKLPNELVRIWVTAHRQLADVLESLDLKRALTAWETSIAYRRQHYGSHVSVADDLLKQAQVLSRLEQFEQAAQVVQEAIEFFQKKKRYSSRLASAYLQYAEILRQLGDDNLAEKFAKDAQNLQDN